MAGRIFYRIQLSLPWKTDLGKSNFVTVIIKYLELIIRYCLKKGKGLPQQAEVAQGAPVRLSPWIFLTSDTTRVVGCQPYAPAAFTTGEITGTHF